MVLTSYAQLVTGFTYCCWVSQTDNIHISSLLMTYSRTIPIFLQDGLEDGVLSKNRICVLEFLRTLSETSELGIQETCVFTWGQIAR